MDNIKQTARSELIWELTSSWTNFVVKSWEWDIFSTSWEAFLEHFENWVCTKREAVSFTRNWDTFVITQRASQACVQNDSATPKTRTQESYSFEAGDIVTEYFSEKHIEQLNNEISSKADDNKVLHKTWNETATWKKTFEEIETTWNTTIGWDTQIDWDLNVDWVISWDWSWITNIVSEVPATQSIFTAGENITAWNAVYVDWSDWKVYKTKADDTNKLWFIWFAKETKNSWQQIKIQTAWVNSNQSSLTIWADYYLSNTAWEISDTPWTNYVRVWKDVNSSSIEIYKEYNENINLWWTSISYNTVYKAETNLIFGWNVTVKYSNSHLRLNLYLWKTSSDLLLVEQTEETSSQTSATRYAYCKKWMYYKVNASYSQGYITWTNLKKY